MIFINFSLLYLEYKQLVLLVTISFSDDYPKVFFPKAFEEEALLLTYLTGGCLHWMLCVCQL